MRMEESCSFGPARWGIDEVRAKVILQCASTPINFPTASAFSGTKTMKLPTAAARHNMAGYGRKEGRKEGKAGRDGRKEGRKEGTPVVRMRVYAHAYKHIHGHLYMYIIHLNIYTCIHI